MSDERRQKIIEMYQQGYSSHEVGDAFGITGSRVHQIVTDAGCSRSRQEAGQLLRSHRDEEIEEHADEWYAMYQRLGSVDAVWRAVDASRGVVSEAIKRRMGEMDFRRKAAPSPSYSDEEMVDSLSRVFDLHCGEYLSLVAYDALRMPGVDPSGLAIARRFGSWVKALKRIGVEGREVGGSRRYSDEDCFDAITRIEGVVGRPPTLAEYRTHRVEGEPGPDLLRARFGGWIAALDARDEASAVG